LLAHAAVLVALPVEMMSAAGLKSALADIGRLEGATVMVWSEGSG
jgi:hypothetical protein